MAGIWIALIVGAIITGASVVGVLVVRRDLELPCALGGLIGFGIAAFAFAVIYQSYVRADAALWALGFMLASAGGGYALVSTLLYRFGATPATPVLSDPLPPDIGSPAVILLACIEPESYDPRETAQMLQSLEEEGLLEVSIGVLPFLFFAQKARYRVVADESPSESQIAALAHGITKSMTQTHPQIDWAACSGHGSLTGAVMRAVARGHRKIVVAEVYVAEPPYLSEDRARLHSLNLASAGVDVRFTGPLWDANRVLAMLAERTVRSVGSEAGVVLVGHGQPDERAKLHPDFDERETTFLNRLRMLLIDRGIGEDRVRVAWADWGAPDVTSSVRHLVALGCKSVLVVPAVFPLDTVSTRLDLELAVRQARVDESGVAITLPPWRDDAAVVEELRARIVAQLSDDDG